AAWPLPSGDPLRSRSRRAPGREGPCRSSADRDPSSPRRRARCPPASPRRRTGASARCARRARGSYTGSRPVPRRRPCGARSPRRAARPRHGDSPRPRRGRPARRRRRRAGSGWCDLPPARRGGARGACGRRRRPCPIVCDLVAPDWDGNGIAKALLALLEEHARGRGAKRFVASIRGNEPEGLAFATAQGYAEFHRRFDAYIDVATFDPSRFDDPDEIARRAGVRLLSYGELARARAGDLETMQRTLIAMFWEVRRDVPSPAPMPKEPPPFEQARRMFF